MKCFHFDAIEKAYIRNYIHANRRLWILGGILLFIFMSDRFFPSGVLSFLIGYGSSGFQYIGGSSNQADIQIYSILVFFVCVIAFFLAIYQFRFLNKRSSCDLYLSLPIKRERLFFLHYWIGVVVLVSTTLGVYFLCLLIGYEYVSLQLALLVGVIIEILGVACFSFLTWIHMKCNSMVDAIFVSCLYLLLPLLLHAGLRTFMVHVEEGVYIADSFSSSYDTDIALLITNFLSPVWLMRSIVELFTSQSFTSLLRFGILASVIFWILMSFLLYLKGMRCFACKHSEESGQRTKAMATYPILIPFFIFVLLLFFTSASFSFITTIILFILYLVLSFFAQREIKLHRSMLLIYVLLVVGVNGAYALMVETSAFGMVHEIPADMGIEEIEVSISKDEITVEENTKYIQETKAYITNVKVSKETLLEIQKEVMDIREKGTNAATVYPNENYYITFTYYGEQRNPYSYDWMRHYRSYYIPQEQEAEMEVLIQRLLEDKIIQSIAAEDTQEEEV